jgi:hypothetical protein
LGQKKPYENWIESTGAPIHRGYYRTVKLGYWPEREGLQSLMPDEAYRNRDCEWNYAQNRKAEVIN